MDISSVLKSGSANTNSELKQINSGIQTLIKVTQAGNAAAEQRARAAAQSAKRSERKSPAAAIQTDKKKDVVKKDNKGFLASLGLGGLITALTAIGPILSALKSPLTLFTNAIKGFGKLLEPLKTPLKKFGKTLKNFIVDVSKAGKNFASKLLEKGKEFGGKVKTDGLKKTLVDKFKPFIDDIAKKFAPLTKVLKNIGTKKLLAGGGILSGLVSGGFKFAETGDTGQAVTQGVGAGVGAVAGGALGALTGPLAPFAVPIGAALGGMIGDYLTEEMRKIGWLEPVEKVINDTVDIFRKLHEWMVPFYEGISEGLGEFWKEIQETFTVMTAVFKQIGEDIKFVGEKLVEGFTFITDKISEWWESFDDAVLQPISNEFQYWWKSFDEAVLQPISNEFQYWWGELDKNVLAPMGEGFGKVVEFLKPILDPLDKLAKNILNPLVKAFEALFGTLKNIPIIGKLFGDTSDISNDDKRSAGKGLVGGLLNTPTMIMDAIQSAGNAYTNRQEGGEIQYRQEGGSILVPNSGLDNTINKETKEIQYRQQGGSILSGLDNVINKETKETKEIQYRQSGGPISVPGSGSGDKVPMMLKPGNFVLNRNASNFLRRQEGGSVPTMLEPGELVYPKTTPGLKSLNKDIPRFQTGGEVSHPDTGSGYQPGNAKDQSGRPVVLSKGASDAFKKMMDDGGVVGTDVASSRRSVEKNAAVGGVPNSAHLGGNAIDIHGASKSWMINNSDNYGWKRNNYMNDSWHWDYTGKGSSDVPKNEGKDDKKENDNTEKKTDNLAVTAGLGGMVGAVALKAMGFSNFGGANPAVMGAILGPAMMGAIGDIVGSIFGFGGGNDKDIKDDGSSTPGAQQGTLGSVGGDVSTQGKSITQALMRDLDMPKVPAAAIAGNMAHESAGFVPGIREGGPFGENSKPWPKGTVGKGYGWAQWTNASAGDRYDKFISSYDSSYSKPPTNKDNYNFLLSELKSGNGGFIPGSLNDYKQLTDPAEAAVYFRKNWERAGVHHDEPRIKYTEDFMKFQEGGSVPTMLEPGEMVFPKTTGGLKQLNSSIPRFQNGGTIKDPEMAASSSPQVIVIESPQKPGGGNNGQSPNNVQTPTAPALSSGPTMTSLSDIINRVSWSNVF